ncbi:MAG: DUF4169 family protein [Pseudomonadota bacterium]|nr:DUF4169 family protein [Pseudomonadota bacterium]
MSKVINLRQFRKRKAREDEAQQAAENRARFGRTKTQKEQDVLEAEAAQRRLDQLRREAADESPEQ